MGLYNVLVKHVCRVFIAGAVPVAVRCVGLHIVFYLVQYAVT